MEVSSDPTVTDSLLASDTSILRSEQPSSQRAGKLPFSAYQTETVTQEVTLTSEPTSDNCVTDDCQNAVVSSSGEHENPKTSTPIRNDVQVDLNSCSGAVGFSPVTHRDTENAESTVTFRDNGQPESTGSAVGRSARQKKRVSFIDPVNVRVPVIGYEVMEPRTKFTVFQLHVHKGRKDWFVFRRYTDFVRLQQDLNKQFPLFRLHLPPKRWLRSNFDIEFLEERKHGLQTFINSILCHSNLCNSGPVQSFFCFTDPPGPHDSMEESRAYCEELEDTVFELKKSLRDKDAEIELLSEELGLYKSQVEMLSKALREANMSSAACMTDIPEVPSSTSSNSLAECDFTAPEADQSNLLLHKRLTNKKQEVPSTSQSELSLQQELMAASADIEKKRKKASNVEDMVNSSGILRILPSSSSGQQEFDMNKIRN